MTVSTGAGELTRRSGRNKVRVICLGTENEGENGERSYKRDEADNYRPESKGPAAKNQGSEWLCSVSHVDEVKLGWQSSTALAQEEKRARNASLPLAVGRKS